MDKVKVAIIGSGNIGTDLMIKIDKSSSLLEVACVIGIDENSEGLAIARERGFSTTHEGIEGAQKLSEWENIKLLLSLPIHLLAIYFEWALQLSVNQYLIS